MWSVRDIKKKGKSALKKNYWRSVVTAALMFLLATVTSALTRIRRESILQNVGFEPLHEMAPNELLIIAGIVVVGYMSIIVSAVLIKIIFANALEAGGCLFFRNNAEKESAELVLIREGFSDYAHVFAALLLRDVFNCLWYCDDGGEQMAYIPVGYDLSGMDYIGNRHLWNCQCSVDAPLL